MRVFYVYLLSTYTAQNKLRKLYDEIHNETGCVYLSLSTYITMTKFQLTAINTIHAPPVSLSLSSHLVVVVIRVQRQLRKGVRKEEEVEAEGRMGGTKNNLILKEVVQPTVM